MTTPPPRRPRGSNVGGWIVLIVIALSCWCCGFASAAVTLLSH